MADDLITVGQVLGAHGIKGWVRVRSYTDPEEQLFDYQPLFLDLPSGSVLLEFEGLKKLTKGWSCKLKGYDDRNAAELLQSISIVMSEEQLPALGEKEYYWRDLIGATVVSLNQQCLGKVGSLLETGASDVLVVDPCEGSLDQRQRLIPFALDRVVVSVDTMLRQIQVDWDPEW